jgi:hypothetical protein
MAKRRNYGFERRQKETARRSRQEAKRDRKSEREQQGESGPEMGVAAQSGPAPGQWEWFSPSRGRVITTNKGQRPQEEPDDWTLLTATEEGEAPVEPV